MIIRTANYKLPPIGTGEHNSNWKGGMPKCLDCGKTLTQRTYKRCKSCSCKGRLNVNYRKSPHLCSRWRGGISKLYKQVHNLFEYRQWRSDVFKRDTFECASCSSRKSLRAHHIKSFLQIFKDNNIRNLKDALECAELWDINNGVSLCFKCHKKIHDHIGYVVQQDIKIKGD